jgi:hypothetical protein
MNNEGEIALLGDATQEIPTKNGNAKARLSWKRVTICGMAWGAYIIMVLVMGKDGVFDSTETVLLNNALLAAAGISGYAAMTFGRGKKLETNG